MAQVRWFNNPFRPFEELEQLRRQMDKLFENVVRRRVWPLSGRVFPPVNITEDDRAYYIRAELPGVKPEHIEIAVEGENVTIGGERKPEEHGKDVSYHRREREFGKFRRVVTLNGLFQHDAIEASCRNGILTITLPKAEAVKPRQIQVKAE